MKILNDRELVELAAKAVGIDGHYTEGWFPGIIGNDIGDADVPWNPLKNNGQAFSLMVNMLPFWEVKYSLEDYEYCRQDGIAATRRSIVKTVVENYIMETDNE